MNEPLVISFNRQVGQSIYLFWLVEPADMGLVMGAICLNMMMFENYWLFLWTILGYSRTSCVCGPGGPGATITTFCRTDRVYLPAPRPG